LNVTTGFAISIGILDGLRPEDIDEVTANWPKDTGGKKLNIEVNSDIELNLEYYSLSITHLGIVIIVSNIKGLRHAFQTLKQLTPITNWPSAEKTSIMPPFSLPFLEIIDYPKYNYRGMFRKFCFIE
jgi:N-acetyl-beta-hexosaminidase